MKAWTDDQWASFREKDRLASMLKDQLGLEVQGWINGKPVFGEGVLVDWEKVQILASISTTFLKSGPIQIPTIIVKDPPEPDIKIQYDGTAKLGNGWTEPEVKPKPPKPKKKRGRPRKKKEAK